MALIFKLSSQPAVESGRVSKKVTSINVKVMNKIQPDREYNIDKLDTIVRKNEHFCIYLVLGILVANALSVSKISRYKSTAILICVLYSISDEFHQAFVPGRGPGIMDVLIDSAGAVVGILIHFIIKIGYC